MKTRASVTVVYKLGTDMRLVYCNMTPEDAVRYAYKKYDQKDMNHWREGYLESTPPLYYGKHFVTCGDYTARIN